MKQIGAWGGRGTERESDWGNRIGGIGLGESDCRAARFVRKRVPRCHARFDGRDGRAWVGLEIKRLGDMGLTTCAASTPNTPNTHT